MVVEGNGAPEVVLHAGETAPGVVEEPVPVPLRPREALGTAVLEGELAAVLVEDGDRTVGLDEVVAAVLAEGQDGGEPGGADEVAIDSLERQAAPASVVVVDVARRERAEPLEEGRVPVPAQGSVVEDLARVGAIRDERELAPGNLRVDGLEDELEGVGRDAEDAAVGKDGTLVHPRRQVAADGFENDPRGTQIHICEMRKLDLQGGGEGEADAVARPELEAPGGSAGRGLFGQEAVLHVRRNVAVAAGEGVVLPGEGRARGLLGRPGVVELGARVGEDDDRVGEIAVEGGLRGVVALATERAGRCSAAK